MVNGRLCPGFTGCRDAFALARFLPLDGGPSSPAAVWIRGANQDLSEAGARRMPVLA